MEGLNMTKNYVIQSEITQQERLKEIDNEYFDTSSKHLKMSIDLNQRLKNAITDVGNALDYSKQTLELDISNGNMAVEILNQEVDLLKQKRDLNENILDSYDKQLADMKSSLQKKGLSFDANGNILNAVSKLQALEQQINAMPDKVNKTKTTGKGKKAKTTTEQVENEAKEEAKQGAENLQKMISDYNNLLHTTIPQTKNSILETSNSINQIYENMLQTVNTVESKITEIIKKQIEERKKTIQDEATVQVNALNKSLQNLQDQHEEKTYEDDLKKQYQKLQEIQEKINDAQLDHSLNGQSNLKELKKEYQDQQDQIDKAISDREYQKAQKKIQDEITSINNNAKEQQDALDKK